MLFSNLPRSKPFLPVTPPRGKPVNASPPRSSIFYDVSSSLSNEEMRHRAATQTAKATIDAAIENGNPTVDLEHLGLNYLPDEIRELEYLRSVSPNRSLIPDLKLFLTGNNLSQLPSFFFSHLENLACLSLRDNKIRYLSPTISQLQKLEELHLSNNQLVSAKD
ncbi:hypothetical protein HK104_010094 [Borealophlyctis nickersoniae]|nr:hypothetical protein HK104_010094 [Borealophlyctis nickersoniae]